MQDVSADLTAALAAGGCAVNALRPVPAGHYNDSYYAGSWKRLNTTAAWRFTTGPGRQAAMPGYGRASSWSMN